jgi:hypothetical protein
MRTISILGVIVLLAVAAPAAPAQAGGVVTVCDEAHLLTALAGGGTVTFACSATITLTAEIVIAADTAIDGSGQEVTISGNNAVRVFTVNPGVTLILIELTVTEGNASIGGGVFVENYATLTVNNSIISDNSGGGIGNGGVLVVNNSSFSSNSAAGGIDNWRGMVTVTHTTFSDNSASGIRNSWGAMTVRNSTFSGNRGDCDGGGILNYGGKLAVSSSTFSENSASDGCAGGGIFNYDFGTVTVDHSTFAGNSAAGGGAIGNWRGMMTVTNSTFSRNSASNGGAISNDPESTLTVSNSTFSGNSANSSGGGIFNYVFGTATVSNSTLSGNSAAAGGGTYNAGGMLTLKNTIVANSPSGGNCYGPITDGGGNLSYPDITCPGINADPLLGPLQDNGGPTETMALGEGSAALDAADDAICAAPPVNNLDQRGVTRPQGTQCDIGAVEQVQEPSAVSVSALRAQSLPGKITPAMIAGLLLLVLVAVGVQRRPRPNG